MKPKAAALKINLTFLSRCSLCRTVSLLCVCLTWRIFLYLFITANRTIVIFFIHTSFCRKWIQSLGTPLENTINKFNKQITKQRKYLLPWKGASFHTNQRAHTIQKKNPVRKWAQYINRKITGKKIQVLSLIQNSINEN